MLMRRPRFGRFRIGAFCVHENNLIHPSPRLRKLLGAIVYQAMCDGMSAVSLGIDCETGDSTMRFFGPIDYPEEKRTWWEMVAPPPACYPQLFQIALTSAELRTEFQAEL